MVRLDVSQKQKFKTARKIPLIFLFIFILPIATYTGYSRRSEFDPVKDTIKSYITSFDELYLLKGMIPELVVFAICLAILIFFLVRSKKRNKAKQTAEIYRSTEGIIDFDDPQSVLEMIVLYQDYISEDLVFDIRKDSLCANLLYNMLTKQELIRLEGQKLYVENVDDFWLEKLILPIDNTIRAIEVGAEIPSTFNFNLDFRSNLVLREEVDDEIVYHLDNIKEVAQKTRDGIETATKWCSQYYDRLRYTQRMPLDTVSSMFLGKVKKMMSFLTLPNKILEEVEDAVHTEYVYYEKPHNPYLLMTGLSTFFIALLFITFLIATSIIGLSQIILLPPAFAAFVLGYILSILATYVILLKEETTEELTDEGEELINRILGLKTFIEEYTQLGEPISDKVFGAWDEFVFFAKIFGLNDKLYEIAKENNVEYNNEEMFDYFKKNSIVDDIFDINKKVCSKLRYPALECGKNGNVRGLRSAVAK